MLKCSNTREIFPRYLHYKHYVGCISLKALNPYPADDANRYKFQMAWSEASLTDINNSEAKSV